MTGEACGKGFVRVSGTIRARPRPNGAAILSDGSRLRHGVSRRVDRHLVPVHGRRASERILATKLSIATKQDDFLIPELDFSSFANAAGQVLKWGTSE